jgi:hypothetical protein
MVAAHVPASVDVFWRRHPAACAWSNPGPSSRVTPRPLVRMLHWSLDRAREERLLSEHDVTRAHIAAPHLLIAWETRDARHWRRTFWNLLLGAAIPLLGCLLLQWPPTTLLVALLLDLQVLWLGDALKPLLAPRRAREERAHEDEAADVMAVVEALRRPRQPVGRDLLAAAPQAGFYVGRLRERFDPPWVRAMGALLLATLPVLSLIGVWWLAPDAFPWLLAGATLRLGGSALSTLRAGRDPGPRAELLAEADTPTLALLAVWFPALLVAPLVERWAASLEPQSLALLLLLAYLLAAAGVAALGLRRVRRFAADLRAFIARDREQLRQRVRQVNG